MYSVIGYVGFVSAVNGYDGLYEHCDWLCGVYESCDCVKPHTDMCVLVVWLKGN